MTFARRSVFPVKQRDREPPAEAPRLERPCSYAGTVRPIAAPVAPKIERKARQSIRDSAKGEACLVRLPGCSHDPEKTIWSHARWGDAGRGKGTKALDLCGAYCCTACDAVYDGQAPLPAGYTREQVDADWNMGHHRSLLRLAEKGLV